MKKKFELELNNQTRTHLQYNRGRHHSTNVDYTDYASWSRYPVILIGVTDPTLTFKCSNVWLGGKK